MALGHPSEELSLLPIGKDLQETIVLLALHQDTVVQESADAGHDDQTAPGYLQAYIFEVIDPRSLDDDGLLGHTLSKSVARQSLGNLPRALLYQTEMLAETLLRRIRIASPDAVQHLLVLIVNRLGRHAASLVIAVVLKHFRSNREQQGGYHGIVRNLGHSHVISQVLLVPELRIHTLSKRLKRRLKHLDILIRALRGAEPYRFRLQHYTHNHQRMEVEAVYIHHVPYLVADDRMGIILQHRAALREGLDYTVILHLLQGQTHICAAHAQHLRETPLGRESLPRDDFSFFKKVYKPAKDCLNLSNLRI